MAGGFKAGDRLMAPGRVTDAALTAMIGRLSAPTRSKNATFLGRLRYWARTAGLDDANPIAQWLVETANGTSPRWLNDNNPAGIGIPLDSTQQPFPIADEEEAAQCLIQAIYAAVTGNLHPHVPLPAAARDWFAGVWLPKVRNARYPDVSIVDDLNIRYTVGTEAHATWAWDSTYTAQQIERMDIYLPDLPAQGSKPVEQGAIVFGRVPPPSRMIDDFVDKPRYAGWDDYGARSKLLAIVLHTVLGYASTTGNYFRTFDPNYEDGGHGWNALTDWGVCNSIDGPARDGNVMNWNDPDNRGFRRSPYASGGYSTPFGDGAAFINAYGRTAINRDTEAIEISNLSNGGEISDKCMASIIELAAWRVDKKGKIPWHQWPKNNDGLQMTISHAEFGKPECHVPDAVFESVIVGVAARLKKFQVVTPADVYAKPMVYDWLSPEIAAEGLDRAIGDTEVIYLPRDYTVVKKTQRRQHAGKSPSVGPDIEAGVTFHSDYCYRSGGVTYVITKRGTRVAARDLFPIIRITVNGTVSERANPDAKPVIVRRRPKPAAAPEQPAA